MTSHVSVVCLLVLFCSTSADAAAPSSDTFRVSGFGAVTIYQPAGPPDQVVLFVSGDGGWNLGVVAMADQLRRLGALVVGIDIRAFLTALDAAPTCAYPAGALEELSRAVQRRYKLPRYHRPVLVGYSSGATLVYAAIASAPAESFAGAISLGFCADLEIHGRLCEMRGLKATRKSKGVGYDLAPYRAMTTPWMVLQGDVDHVCAAEATRTFTTETGMARLFSLPKVGHGFGVPTRWEPQLVDAYRAIIDTTPSRSTAMPTTPIAGSPDRVDDLDLVEVPVTGGTPSGTMAVILTGDGGWAELDKEVAAHLAANGVPTVGWSSLDYYWTPRSPAQAAEALGRVLDHYTRAWSALRVIVVGYSFGADVAPFLVNRLSDALKRHVVEVALLGPSDAASFEFHVAGWLGVGAGPQLLTLPEIARLTTPVLCVTAEGDDDSPCARATQPRMRTVSIGAGHHFSGRYLQVAQAILAAEPAR